jgi:hypothetical protein
MVLWDHKELSQRPSNRLVTVLLDTQRFFFDDDRGDVNRNLEDDGNGDFTGTLVVFVIRFAAVAVRGYLGLDFVGHGRYLLKEHFHHGKAIVSVTSPASVLF